MGRRQTGDGRREPRAGLLSLRGPAERSEGARGNLKRVTPSLDPTLRFPSHLSLLTQLRVSDYIPPFARKGPGAPPVPKGHVPKRNYGFEKHQKELAKLQKRQLKAERRAERAATRAEESQVPLTDPPIPPEE